MLKNKLYRKIVGLHDFISELEGDDYYNAASNKALKNYGKAIGYLKERFNELEETNYRSLYVSININVIPRLRFIQRAKTRNIPWSLISNLDELLKNEIGDNCFLLLRPQWNFNYSVFTEDVNTYLKKMLEVFYPEDEDNINNLFSDEKIHIFSFPFLEKNNVILNSVIGHEIGHFYHKKWEEETYEKKEVEYNTILKAYYESHFKGDLITPYNATKEGLAILKGLYREVIPDIFGYFLFGPSLIFALFYDFSTFEAMQKLPSQQNDYYPMMKYRIRILVKYLLKNDTGLKKLLDDNKPEVSAFLKKMIGKIEIYLQDENDLSLWSNERGKEISLFESSLDEIILNIKNNFSREYLKYENIGKLYDCLERNIPINELDNIPVDIMEIILAGWVYFVKINETYEGDDYVLNYQILMRLLLKSLHSSFVHKDYIGKGMK
jgi:hypothetical protein